MIKKAINKKVTHINDSDKNNKEQKEWRSRLGDAAELFKETEYKKKKLSRRKTGKESPLAFRKK